LTDVFVSYSREDQEVARRFAENFASEGLSVWWDQALNPGEAFDQVTELALEEARAVVVLWSKHSVNSRWVRAEATQASANNRLLPVMIEPCRRPIMFELTHTADLSGWDGNAEDPAWLTFSASVRRFVERRGPVGSAVPAVAPAPAAAPAPAVTTKPPIKRAPSTQGAAPASFVMPRRKALVYGASALGLVAAGFTGGVLVHGGGAERSAKPQQTFQRLTFRRGLVRSARFAPDGQTILYGALWDGELCRVHSTRTDNPESRALDLPNATVLAVSHAGDMALGLGPHMDGVFTYGTLARAPLAGGAPRKLAENVKFADWSPDGTTLAAIRRVDDVDHLEYPLGKVVFQPQAGAGLGLGFVRFSPDGRQLAFIHYRAQQSLLGTICVIDGSGKVSVLTEEYVQVHGLAWRGEEICYSASDDRPLFRSVLAVRPGAKPRVVARMPVNLTVWDATTDGRLLIAQTDDRAAMIGRLAGDAHDRDLSWLDASRVADLSRDGSTVLFSETGQGVRSVPGAYLRGTDGSPAVRLGNGQALTLSPDMQWALILNEDPARAGAGNSVDLVPTGAGEPRPLLQGLNYNSASWLPDGGRILVRASEPGRKYRIYRGEMPKADLQPVTPEGIASWAVSPDGSILAASDLEAAISLYPLRGGAMRTVPGTLAGSTLIGWINDGLLVMRRSDPAAPRGAVYLLDVATGRQKVWGNIQPRDGAGIMLMLAFFSTPDGTTQVFSWHRALSNLYLADGLA
jgi:eukaryotic-like serine/threonine-protein kinase